MQRVLLEACERLYTARYKTMWSVLFLFLFFFIVIIVLEILRDAPRRRHDRHEYDGVV